MIAYASRNALLRCVGQGFLLATPATPISQVNAQARHCRVGFDVMAYIALAREIGRVFLLFLQNIRQTSSVLFLVSMTQFCCSCETRTSLFCKVTVPY